MGDIIAVLRDRAFALLVVLLGLPNCLPMPPPIPLLCGLLLGLVAVQIVAGRASPWVPKAILARSIAREDVARAVGRAMPALRRLEHWSKPRMAVFESPLALRLVGVLLFALALGLLFAAPVVGFLVLAGLGVGALGVTLSLGFIWAIVAALGSLF